MVPAAIFVRSTLLVAVVGASAACAAQSSPSTPSDSAWRLSGTIYSAAGGPIPGAQLTVREGANKDLRVTSDSLGRYAFANLESGRFTMIIEAPGFISVAPVVDLYKDLEVDFALYKTR